MFAVTQGGRLNVVKEVKKENKIVWVFNEGKNEFKQRDSKLK